MTTTRFHPRTVSARQKIAATGAVRRWMDRNMDRDDNDPPCLASRDAAAEGMGVWHRTTPVVMPNGDEFGYFEVYADGPVFPYEWAVMAANDLSLHDDLRGYGLACDAENPNALHIYPEGSA